MIVFIHVIVNALGTLCMWTSEEKDIYKSYLWIANNCTNLSHNALMSHTSPRGNTQFKIKKKVLLNPWGGELRKKYFNAIKRDFEFSSVVQKMREICKGKEQQGCEKQRINATCNCFSYSIFKGNNLNRRCSSCCLFR